MSVYTDARPTEGGVHGVILIAVSVCECVQGTNARPTEGGIHGVILIAVSVCECVWGMPGPQKVVSTG